MATQGIKHLKKAKKSSGMAEIRKKLGLSQAQLAAMFNHTRNYITMIELGKRSVQSAPNIQLSNMYQQFSDLETGKLDATRSLETMAFLNEEYKKILPAMKALEQYCRLKIKMLKKAMDKMKEKAREAEYSIIVYTNEIHRLEAHDQQDHKTQQQIVGFNLFKEQAYNKLLTCWEPEQAKLDGNIEAIKGEAKALRRYRVKVTREHNPFKK